MEHSIPLTIGQRCADWFVLRRFRITGTIASLLMASNPRLSEILSTRDLNQEEERPDSSGLMSKLVASWFSRSRSTEAMKRGSGNENPMATYLSGNSASVCITLTEQCHRDRTTMDHSCF